MSGSPEFEVKIHSASYGGAGVGRLPDGRAVFVPFTIVGERVRIRVPEDTDRAHSRQKSFVRAELVEVLEPAPARITPRCQHFGECGGCHYQHMTYAAQLEMKGGILAETLRRIGEITEPLAAEVIPSPLEWQYRNHTQYHLAEDNSLGYQAAHSHRVIPIRACPLPVAEIETARIQFSIEPLPGLEKIAVRAGEGGDLQWVLESHSSELPALKLDLPDSVVHLSPAGEVVMAGSSFTILRVGERDFQVSAGSFFQVNTSLAARMVAQVLAWLPDGKVHTLLDLYCGVGLFSVFCAERTERLVGVEESPWACRDYAANLDEFDHVELYQGRAEEILPALDLHPEIVILDPPRAGLAVSVLHRLVEMHPARIIYVSCDPTTLARDLKQLRADGYQIEHILPLDMFPQTYHLECLVLLSRAGSMK